MRGGTKTDVRGAAPVTAIVTRPTAGAPEVGYLVVYVARSAQLAIRSQILGFLRVLGPLHGCAPVTPTCERRVGLDR